VLSIALGLELLGCTATCIRDSDCLGKSVCSENRCILIVGRDAGRTRGTPGDGADDVPSSPDASTPAPSDAGN
jgi:hypothetical protein